MMNNNSCYVDTYVINRCDDVVDEFCFTSSSAKYYFKLAGISIRIPKRVAEWLFDRCDNVYVRIDGCQIVQCQDDVLK